MIPQWIIEKKRDGGELDDSEIRDFIAGYAAGRIPDYQMSALAMAIFFRGMTSRETAALTDSMMRSGDILDTSSVRMPKVDKHSTGGIGDKVSLVLAPLVACCGIAVPMISGRGLGITGGTLDKMEAIPGYRTNLSTREFLKVLNRCGCSIIGQTSQLAPADKKLYALRDVTGTVPSIPLISASIMSKKLAEGIDALALDATWGNGAFMRKLSDGRTLAAAMVGIGRGMGKKVTAVITDMNQPLGRTVGNSVEVIESVEALQGKGPSDLMEVTLLLAAHMLLMAKRASSVAQARKILNGHIESGAAFEKFLEMVRIHGGNLRTLQEPRRLPSARIKRDIPAGKGGFVAEVNAELVGKACLLLGAGRCKTDDRVDHAVGITGLVKIGEPVARRQPLLTIHANSSTKADQAAMLLRKAISVIDHSAKPPRLILDTI